MILTRFGWVMVVLMLTAICLFAATTHIGSRDVPARSAAPDTGQLMTFGDPDADAAAPPATPAGLLALPVAGVKRGALTSNYGDPRGEGDRLHEGLDIMAPQGAPVLAAAPGRIEKLYFSEGGGGITVYERSADGRRSYYYAHLQGYAPGLREGMRVKAGQWIANVGDSGNAGPGNYHLHFGVAQMSPDSGWWEGEPIDPYPLIVGSSGDGA